MKLAPLLLAAPVLAGAIPFGIMSGAADIIAAVDQFFASPEDGIPELTVSTGFSAHHGGVTGICSLRAKGGGQDDSDNFVNTIKRCGKNSVVYMNSAV